MPPAEPHTTRTTEPAPATAPLIGTEGLATPPWAQVGEHVARSGSGRMLAAAPVTLRELARLAWRASPPLSLLAAALELASGCATSFGLLATTTVFAELLAQGPTPQRVVAALPALALAAGAYAARGALESAVGAVHASLAPRVEQHAQDELHAAVIDTELVAFDDAGFTELVRRSSTQGILIIREAVTDAGTLLSSLVSLAAAVATAGLLHPVLAPVVLLAAAPHGWACLRAAKLDYQSLARTVSHVQRRAVTSDLITSRDPAAEIRAYTTGPTLLAEHRRINTQLAAEAVRVEHRKTVVRLLGRGMAGVGAVLAYGVLGALLYAGIMPLALAGAAAIAMRTATTAVATTVQAANRVFEEGFYLDMLNTCLATARRYRHRVPSTARRLAPGPHLIELHDVSFTYPGKDEPALTGIGLTLEPGHVVALVGENGSGKTTLAKLIAGLYRPDRGKVTWDGLDIAEIHPDELHAHLTLLPQSPTPWPMTAENNVRIGRLERPDPDRRALNGAAEAAGLDAIVTGLPRGWKSLLSRQFQTGHDLSGGQWQRVSAARGLYRNAPLLIADEPTAALDARAEQIIFRSLHSPHAADGGTTTHPIRTTILITHRLANIRHADDIVVLDKGRITERGTHEQLIRHGGTYAELFDIQARNYLHTTTNNNNKHRVHLSEE
ncbi:ABC transporter ATP-binding protein [Pseudonocardia acaciae]|uniref:ABC transporter ATP-binding protein n=1 Tax=Pseudonocardia acaciae TaxID=551276 RepID=UPI000686F580|nr:ABC transporter ATP-binding protein [Pseudonocardia acaciae]